MSERLVRNQQIELEITDLNNLGCGVGRYDGAVVFVRGAVSGDRVRAAVIKVNKSYYVARLLEVLRPSEHRINQGVCRAPESCGGCVYRHIDYAYELELKRNMVREAFRRAGVEAEIARTRATGVTSGYRNKAQFPVARGRDGRLRAGIYATKTHSLAGGCDCQLQPGVFGNIAAAVCDFGDRHGWEPYDESRGRGVLRHIYLRRGEVSGNITVCLVVNGGSVGNVASDKSAVSLLPGGGELCRELTAAFPDISGIMLNVNSRNTNVILGEQFIPLWGSMELADRLCGLDITLAPDSFYQVNHDCAELLYGLAGELAGQGGTLVDLYCGAGTIGLSMAERFESVIGIEIVPSAVECAWRNARRNGIKNVYYSCGDAAEAGGILARAEAGLGRPIQADVVVLDPPRRGCDRRLIEYISGRGVPRVVYVSCDCVTLARDCAIFAGLGYSVGTVTPVDMFPRTGHVETVVLLSKGEVDSKKIRVEFSLEDMDMSESQDGATYTQIKDYVLEHSGLQVSNLYISQIKRKCGIEVGKNYNLPNSENSRQPLCPPDKEKAIKEALKHFGVI